MHREQLSPGDLLIAKFYVVDGLHYVASETATGHFDGHGMRAFAVCDTLGFDRRKSKGRVTRAAFLHALGSLRSQITPLLLDADPVEHYLSHHGFRVRADSAEIKMARCYLVERKTLEDVERLVGVTGKKGFAAHNAVCKLGGLRGRVDRGSMSPDEFNRRLKVLRLVGDASA